MAILFLGIARHRHTPAKEGQVPEVREHHAGAGIHGENPHTGKRRDHTDPEAQHVRHRGDRDRHGRLAIRMAHARRHVVVDGCASPGGQQHKGVVNANAEHEEGGGQVDADKVHAEVHHEAEGGDGGQNGRQNAEQTKQRLGLDPVRHHAGEDAEDDHDADVEGKVGDDGVGVLLQLLLQSERGKAVDPEAGQHGLGRLDGGQKGGLPPAAPPHHPLLTCVQKVKQAHSLHTLDDVAVLLVFAEGEPAQVHGEGVGAERVRTQPDRVGQVQLTRLHLRDVGAQL